jgi:hypothetical protein
MASSTPWWTRQQLPLLHDQQHVVAVDTRGPRPKAVDLSEVLDEAQVSHLHVPSTLQQKGVCLLT